MDKQEEVRDYAGIDGNVDMVVYGSSPVFLRFQEKNLKCKQLVLLKEKRVLIQQGIIHYRSWHACVYWAPLVSGCCFWGTHHSTNPILIIWAL